MTVSRNNRPVPGLPVLATALILATSSAWAQQDSSPRPLLPPPGAQPQETEPEDLPADAVTVDDLGTVDPDSVGLLGEDDGGLGLAMWQGTPRARAERLIALSPSGMTSHVMNDLARRVLTSIAHPPEGPGEGRGGLLERRVDALMTLGAVDEALAMIETVPGQARGEALIRARVDAYLIEDRRSLACTEARDAIRRFDTPYWQKLLVFCQIEAEEKAAAGLGLTILREMGVDDPVFFWAADALMGLEPLSLGSMPLPTPLHIAMLARSGRALPEDASLNASPGALRAIAAAEALAPVQRIEAGETAEAMGALPTEDLRAIYRTTPMTEEDWSEPLTRAQNEWNAEVRAVLFQAAERSDVAAVRAEIIAESLNNARRDMDQYFTTARVMAPLIGDVPVTQEYVWFSAAAGRALLAAGRFESARAWLDLAETHARANAEAAAAASRLWPLKLLSDHNGSLSVRDGQLLEWLDVQTDSPRGRRLARAAVVFGAFDILGERLSSDTWLALTGDPPRTTVTMPDSALWHGIRQSTINVRAAETVLLSLAAIGPDGPREASPMTLYRVAGALEFIGLESDARRLLIESAIAMGL